MLSTFTERYEHATFDKTNRKELNRTSRLPSNALFLCFTDHTGSFSYLIHLQSHLSKTKIIHSFFFLHNSPFRKTKYRLKTFITTPVHLLHTIGSQKYFGHFCVFNKQQHFIIKSCINTETECNR